MIKKNKITSQEYWQQNIQGFSGFYDRTSEETLQGPSVLTSIYKAIIFPLEKKYMRQRFNMVSAYIAQNARSGMAIADIGCGCGIYTKQAASLGAKVYALDFVDNALALTRKNLTGDELKFVQFLKMDITRQAIPKVDMVISIGVLPYVDGLDSFFDNVLPYTDLFLFNFLDAESWLNILRKKMPVLDVRGYSYFSASEVRQKLAAGNFEIVDIQKLATGFVVQSKRIKK